MLHYSPILLSIINISINEFFETSNTPDTNHMTQWETHKCVIRGLLVKMTANRKRIKQKAINSLLNQIQNLEKAHKLTRARHTQAELDLARASLREELGKKVRRNYALAHKHFYGHSNKSGKLLARATTIRSIHTSPGQLLTNNDDIANHFVQYYAELFNLTPEQNPPKGSRPRKSIINNNNTQYSQKTISKELALKIGGPLKTRVHSRYQRNEDYSSQMLRRCFTGWLGTTSKLVNPTVKA